MSRLYTTQSNGPVQKPEEHNLAKQQPKAQPAAVVPTRFLLALEYDGAAFRFVRREDDMDMDGHPARRRKLSHEEASKSQETINVSLLKQEKCTCLLISGHKFSFFQSSIA